MLLNLCVHYLTLVSLFTLAVKEDSSTEFLQQYPTRDQESSVRLSSSFNGILQSSRLEGHSTVQKKALGKVGVEGNVVTTSIKSLLGKRSTDGGKEVGIEGKVEDSFYLVDFLQKRPSEIQEKVEFFGRSQHSAIALPKTLVEIKGELPDNFISSSRAPKRPKSVGKMLTVSSEIRNNGGKYSGGKLRRKRRALNFPGGTSLQFGVCYFPFVVGTHGLFNFGITLGSNWELPEHVDKYKQPAAGHSRARKEKRSLYPKIESLLTRIGLQGEQCVLRALCQLSSRRSNKQSYPIRNRPFDRFVDVILGVLFHYPPASDVREPYDRYDSATKTHTCDNDARLCPWVT
uniref:Uncharacterized protein n=1 Tax=Cacopsylla melanoneura TaxID=428564 RepID=A0A8D9BEX0_9HEMI